MVYGAPYDASGGTVPVAEKVVGRQLPRSDGKLPWVAAESEGSRPIQLPLSSHPVSEGQLQEPMEY